MSPLQPQRARVALVDAMVGGHHTPYATIVARILRDQGAEVRFYGHPSIHNELLSSSLASGGLPQGHKDGREPFRLLRRTLTLGRLLSAARRDHCDSLILLFADRWWFPWLLGGCDWPGGRVLACFHQVYLQAPPPRGIALRIFRSQELRAISRIIRSGGRIVLHTREQLLRLSEFCGRDGLEFVPYPVDFGSEASPDIGDGALIRSRLGIEPDSVVLLCFGATRRQKGADIAARTLAHLPDHWHLIVAGRSIDFDRRSLLSLAGEASCRLHVVDDLVPDEEVASYFAASDICFLPYRHDFWGQSGPLTIAAARGLPVLASDNEQLSGIVQAFEIGEVFEGLDPAAAGRAAQALVGRDVSRGMRAFCLEHAPDRVAEAFLGAMERTGLAET